MPVCANIDVFSRANPLVFCPFRDAAVRKYRMRQRAFMNSSMVTAVERISMNRGA